MITEVQGSLTGHDRVKKTIYDSLAVGKLKLGHKLPSIREIGRSLGETPDKVRRGLLELASEGVLEIRHGSGAYVKSVPRHTDNKRNKDVLLWFSDMKPNWYNTSLLEALENLNLKKYVISIVGKNIEDKIRSVSGVIAAAPCEEELRALYDIGGSLPMVSLSRSYLNISVPAVIEDGYHAAYDLTKWLIRHGHKRIAFVSQKSEQGFPYMVSRLHGWEAAMCDSGLDMKLQPIHWLKSVNENGHMFFSAMREVFLKHDFDAMFCPLASCLEEAMRCDSLDDLNLSKRFGIAGIDRCASLEGVAYASHDFERMIQAALNKVETCPLDSDVHAIERVPMKLSLPDSVKRSGLSF
jgi:DNA-binding LacI/PurR family transcriptional regulator